METKQLKLIFQTLDDVRHQNGEEYWYARELYPCLGYPKWESFYPVIEKSKDSCKNAGSNIDEHFLNVTKMVESVDGLKTEIKDIKLTRYACYLIAVNGNPKKQEIAFAQAYFITKTREFERIEKRIEELERLDAREKLKFTEKEFSAMAFTRGVDGKGIAIIRSRGDQELFGQPRTANIKDFLKIPNNKPVADVLPTVTLKAKDLATAITTENSRQNNLQGTTSIGKEHVKNNQTVRKALIESGIYPENLSPAEDIKIIESKHRKELKLLKEKQKKELQESTEKFKKKLI